MQNFFYIPMQKFCSTSEDNLTTFNFFHAAHHMNVPRLSPWKILVVSFYQFTTFFTQCGWELATEFSTTLKMAWLRFFFTHHQIPEGRGVAPFSVENFLQSITWYSIIKQLCSLDLLTSAYSKVADRTDSGLGRPICHEVKIAQELAEHSQCHNHV